YEAFFKYFSSRRYCFMGDGEIDIFRNRIGLDRGVNYN
ncbi:MAG: hypothetical protein RIT41_1550, partial [Bacteroidota bacterium]